MSSPKTLLSACLHRLRKLPPHDWPAQWRQFGVRGDVLAGITVALVMVPQALAYAQLAGLPPYIGLYAALLPAVVSALLGNCASLSTGPVALTALLTGASLLPFAQPGSPQFLSLAILLALLSGAVQLALGLARGGWLLNLLSRPVMSGFINAAALLICMSQLPAILGLSLPASDHFLLSVARMLTGLGQLHLPTLGFGLGALAGLIVLRRYVPKWPGVLIIVAISTALSAALGFAASGGSVVGDIPAGLPTLNWPQVSWNQAIALMPAAFVIALVSFMEVTSSATLISSKTGQRWQQDQELIAQGLAKFASAFSGAMPVSASFSRSALNHANGARTGLSSLIMAGCVVIALLYLTPLLWHLPKPVLAAIILQVVFGLLNFGSLRRAWQASRDDGLAATVTFASTLAFAPNIHHGILTGLLLSLALMLYRDMRPRIAMLGLHADGTYRDLVRFGLPHPDPHVVILRLDSPLTFVTASRFESAVIDAQDAQPEIRTVLISAAGINTIDASGLDALEGLRSRLAARGQTLAFCGLKKQVIDAMDRTGLWARLAEHADYRTEAHALTALGAATGARAPDPIDPP